MASAPHRNKIWTTQVTLFWPPVWLIASFNTKINSKLIICLGFKNTGIRSERLLNAWLGDEPLYVSVWRSSERKGLLTDWNGSAVPTPEACPFVEDRARRKKTVTKNLFLFKFSKCLVVRFQRISKRYSFKKTFSLSHNVLRSVLPTSHLNISLGPDTVPG